MIVSLIKRWGICLYIHVQYIAAANEEFDPFAGASLGSECDALKSGINLSQQLQKSGRNTDRVVVEKCSCGKMGQFPHECDDAKGEDKTSGLASALKQGAKISRRKTGS